jgi:DNA mismatch repair protein MSH5
VDRLSFEQAKKSQNQSAFLIDVQQISLALTLATRRSLIIIDEFGKGTDSNGKFHPSFATPTLKVSADGAGLCCGTLEYLLSLGSNRPKVLAATHFNEIFENGFLPRRPELSFGHMEIRVDEGAREVESQMTYLYK